LLDALRMAFRIARHERPFTIELVAILPEHLHVIWTCVDAPFGARRIFRTARRV